MSVNFNLSREQMSKEIDQCIALNRMDTLLSLCNSCVSSMLERRFEYECQNCKIRFGINKILSKKKTQEFEEEEFIGIG